MSDSLSGSTGYEGDYNKYGLPDVMISDRGPQFTSNVFNGIIDALRINHRMSTAFHPQTDGQTE